MEPSHNYVMGGSITTWYFRVFLVGSRSYSVIIGGSDTINGVSGRFRYVLPYLRVFLVRSRSYSAAYLREGHTQEIPGSCLGFPYRMSRVVEAVFRLLFKVVVRLVPCWQVQNSKFLWAQLISPVSGSSAL